MQVNDPDRYEIGFALEDEQRGDGVLFHALQRLGRQVGTQDPFRLAVHEFGDGQVEHAITSLFVFDNEESRRPVDIVHLHDLLRAGVV